MLLDHCRILTIKMYSSWMILLSLHWLMADYNSERIQMLYFVYRRVKTNSANNNLHFPIKEALDRWSWWLLCSITEMSPRCHHMEKACRWVRSAYCMYSTSVYVWMFLISVYCCNLLLWCTAHLSQAASWAPGFLLPGSRTAGAPWFVH